MILWWWLIPVCLGTGILGIFVHWYLIYRKAMDESP